MSSEKGEFFSNMPQSSAIIILQKKGVFIGSLREYSGGDASYFVHYCDD